MIRMDRLLSNICVPPQNIEALHHYLLELPAQNLLLPKLATSSRAYYRLQNLFPFQSLLDPQDLSTHNP